jgi:predicted branched-subunit amino acid permease
MLGLALTPYLGWTLGTLLGAVAGNVLPYVVTVALSVAIYGMFIAIIVPPAKEDLSILLCVLIAVALSCAFYFAPYLNLVPSGFRIIICSCLAALIMALIKPIKINEKPQTETDGQKDGAL